MSVNEIIDVVNENDEIIAQLPKKDVHAGKGILHREIAIIIFDEDQNILLQQRSFKKDYFPGKWSITATGHVGTGQTPEEAAQRELKEELNIVTNLQFVEKKKYVTGNHVSFGYLFTGIVPKDTKFEIDKTEVNDAKFFSSKVITQMISQDLIEVHSAKDLKRFLS